MEKKITQKAAKTYRGNHPETGWDSVGRFECSGGVAWEVYAQPSAHTDGWWTYKVAAHGRAASKANYWFTHNRRTGRFGYGKDITVMKAARADLYKYVMAILED